MKKTLGILCLSVGLSRLYAQESVNTSGGSVSDENGGISFSVGQVVYTSASTDGGTIEQGVQQTYNVKILSIANNFKDKALELEAFPNPLVNELHLKNSSNMAELEFFLYDISGTLLEQGN